MAQFGAVLRLGAGGRLLTLDGVTWDFTALDPHQLSACSSLLSDAMALPRSKPSTPKAKAVYHV